MTATSTPKSVCTLEPGTAHTLPLSQHSSLETDAASGRLQLCEAIPAAILRAGGCGRHRVQPCKRPQSRVRLSRRVHWRGRYALRSCAQRQRACDGTSAGVFIRTFTQLTSSERKQLTHARCADWSSPCCLANRPFCKVLHL